MIAGIKQVCQRREGEIRQETTQRLSHLESTLKAQEELVGELQEFAKVAECTRPISSSVLGVYT